MQTRIVWSLVILVLSVIGAFIIKKIQPGRFWLYLINVIFTNLVVIVLYYWVLPL